MNKIIRSFLIITFISVFNSQISKAQDADQILDFKAMEKPPSYPGGIAKFYAFLGKNIKYPKLAQQYNRQGTVEVSFVVEKDGTLTNIAVIEKLGSGLDEEAMRVLGLSKKWEPGIQDGKPVRVKYTIPIKFALGR